MSNITRAASTDEQETSLKKVERWAKNCDFSVRFGTTIGKSPQTVILDHKYQDSLIYVNSDGKIKINNEEILSLNSFRKIVTEIGNE